MLYGNSAKTYENKIEKLKIYDSHYWKLLLHMNGNESEIDDPNFFFAQDGKTNPKNELYATLDAFYSQEVKDDNSSICRFPARFEWIKNTLEIKDFPLAHCEKYEKIFNRVDPKSVTLVFPSAHINSPASMFGHTFLRINSSYNSKLLSYAVNYAANANTETENGVIFALKGLFGGYYGKYSLLPYYEKLKEYRDSEQRDIWEYDLNLSVKETQRMFRHIWELNDTNSFYYFFTENCSYNMLWLLEVARPSLHLRDKFLYQVIPLETVHVIKEENLIISDNYRASKRTVLLKYEALIDKEFIHLAVELIDKEFDIKNLLENKKITKQQKMYILEASIEYLEYQRSKSKVTHEVYLERFHQLTKTRANLGTSKPIKIETPNNPIESHRAFRASLGTGSKDGDFIAYLGIRPAYHDLLDSNYGFLRGTQIEFMNLLFSKSLQGAKVEKATIVSIVSLAQRSEFFKNFSWRMNLGWDNNYLSDDTTFNTSVGAGYSWGNEFGYLYLMLDPFIYMNNNFTAGVGGSFGLNIDKYDLLNTNIELTQRFYDNGFQQKLIQVSQGFRMTQNSQIMLKYDYKDKKNLNANLQEDTLSIMLNYYF